MPEWRKINRPLLLKLFWHVERLEGADDPATGCHCSTLSARQALSSFQPLIYISILATFIRVSGQTPSAAPSGQTAPRTARAHQGDRQTHGERTNIIKPENKHTHYSISSLRLLDKEGNLFLTQSQAQHKSLNLQYDLLHIIMQMTPPQMYSAAQHSVQCFYFSKCLFMNTSPEADTHPTIA